MNSKTGFLILVFVLVILLSPVIRGVSSFVFSLAKGMVWLIWSVIKGAFHLLRELWTLTDFLIPSEVLALVLVILVWLVFNRAPSKS